MKEEGMIGDVVKLAMLSEQFALGFKGIVISVADSGKSPLLSIILPAVGLRLFRSLSLSLSLF